MAPITIGGIQLTDAQSLAVHVALCSYRIEMAETGLGDDEHGKTMARLYLERLGEVLKLMHPQ